ncbi:MAG: Unknown protein [uncultured Sulfurovum sp.]|uniref:Uncharacterized protein n=1 Tax=uncultured Sulfurovum sp. TaxID=269237 RepID=A0A6S6RZ80_9BACT|nr:MAG: Unknown protein [uncultured Sulfurovum sp.]
MSKTYFIAPSLAGSVKKVTLSILALKCNFNSARRISLFTKLLPAKSRLEKKDIKNIDIKNLLFILLKILLSVH